MSLLKTILFFVATALFIEAKEHKHQNRLSGGSSAGVGQFPFAVIVQSHEFISFHTICGGSLISPNYVLTAAQCKRDQQMRVVAGTTTTSKFFGNGESRLVHTKTIHPNFTVNGNDIRNDIALLRLTNSFQLSQNISTIGLSTSNYLLATATFAGFGNRDHFYDLFPNSLQYGTNLDIINTNDCKMAVGSAYSNYVKSSNICAKYAHGNACKGDEGSALFQGNRTIGIMSWTPFSCSEKDKAIVFTKISPYVTWIRGVTNI